MHLLFIDPSGRSVPNDPVLALTRSTGARVTVCTRRPAALVGRLTDEIVVVNAVPDLIAARAFCTELSALAIAASVLVVAAPGQLGELGAGWVHGDVVTDSASAAEFLARVRRLVGGRSHRAPRHLGSGDLSLDLHRCTLRAGDRSITLSVKEAGALSAFLTSNGAVLTREELSAHCSDGRADHARHVDVFICRLRRKLGPQGSRIETVRRVGYRLAAADDPRSLSAA